MLLPDAVRSRALSIYLATPLLQTRGVANPTTRPERLVRTDRNRRTICGYARLANVAPREKRVGGEVGSKEVQPQDGLVETRQISNLLLVCG